MHPEHSPTTEPASARRKRWQRAGLRSLHLATSFVLTLPAAADVQSSANYAHTTLALTGGGDSQSSANYRLDGIIGEWGSGSVSADPYDLAPGFPAQLNNPPVIANLNRTLEIGTGIRLAVSALSGAVTDPDGDAVTLVAVDATGTEGGWVAYAGEWITFLPAADFENADSFSFTVRDDWGDTSVGWVFLSLSQATDAPTVNLVALEPIGGTSVRLQFAGVAGRAYRVEFTDSLVSPITWTVLGTVQAPANGLLSIIDPTAGLVAQRFYRTALP